MSDIKEVVWATLFGFFIIALIMILIVVVATKVLPDSRQHIGSYFLKEMRRECGEINGTLISGIIQEGNRTFFVCQVNNGTRKIDMPTIGEE